MADKRDTPPPPPLPAPNIGLPETLHGKSKPKSA
jgi:hypothetical protein